MWMIAQIAVCLIFVILAAFVMGRKLGQRRFYRTEEEMRAVELSFKNLMEDVEMVSAHNMKVLETRSEEIKELMAIVDRKSLYVHDLLKEMDESSASLRMRNIDGASVVTSIETGAERRANKELQLAFEALQPAITDLFARVAELEENQTVFNGNDLVELVRREVNKQLQSLRSSPPETLVRSETAALAAEAMVKIETPTPMAETELSTPIQRLPTESSVGLSRPKNVKELRIAPVDDADWLPKLPKKTDLAVEKMPLKHAGNFPVNEVLKQYADGITLPQIARSLNMSKSEIELILKFYGEGVNMRKIV